MDPFLVRLLIGVLAYFTHRFTYQTSDNQSRCTKHVRDNLVDRCRAVCDFWFFPTLAIVAKMNS